MYLASPEPVDSFGDLLLTCLFAQGLPASSHVVQVFEVEFGMWHCVLYDVIVMLGIGSSSCQTERYFEEDTSTDC